MEQIIKTKRKNCIINCSEEGGGHYTQKNWTKRYHSWASLQTNRKNIASPQIVKQLYFPRNFMLRVSFSPAPEWVDRVCWNRSFSTPPRVQEHRYSSCCYCFSPFTYSFLIKAGFLESEFHYTTIFWILATYHFFPQLYVAGLLFSRPLVCRPCLLEPLFFDPPRAQEHCYCYY